MSATNIAELKSLFSPPAPHAGMPTTQDMQKTALLANLEAKLGQNYAAMELPEVQAAQKTVNAEINANPVTASAALRAEQEALQAKAQSLELVLNQQYLNYTNGVAQWYLDMTSGSKYVPLDQFSDTQPASYPDLFAAAAAVTF